MPMSNLNTNQLAPCSFSITQLRDLQYLKPVIIGNHLLMKIPAEIQKNFDRGHKNAKRTLTVHFTGSDGIL